MQAAMSGASAIIVVNSEDCFVEMTQTSQSLDLVEVRANSTSSHVAQRKTTWNVRMSLVTWSFPFSSYLSKHQIFWVQQKHIIISSRRKTPRLTEEGGNLSLILLMEEILHLLFIKTLWKMEYSPGLNCRSWIPLTVLGIWSLLVFQDKLPNGRFGVVSTWSELNVVTWCWFLVVFVWVLDACINDI